MSVNIKSSDDILQNVNSYLIVEKPLLIFAREFGQMSSLRTSNLKCLMQRCQMFLLARGFCPEELPRQGWDRTRDHLTFSLKAAL